MLSHSFGSSQWIRPELSNFFTEKVLVTERSEPLRAGDFACGAQRFAAGPRQGPEGP